MYSYTLSPGETEITGISALINNDHLPESHETFTLRASPEYYGGSRCYFKCYDDGETPVEGNYFCSHTITIVDDDGKFPTYCLYCCCLSSIRIQNMVRDTALNCKPSAQLHCMLQQPARTIIGLKFTQLGYGLVSCLVLNVVGAVHVRVCTYYSLVHTCVYAGPLLH